MADRNRMTELDRIESRAKWRGECLVWTGPLDRYGYGKVSNGRLVHRVAWIERHGPLPSDKPIVMHICDNPPCIRDEHLTPGTVADNMADMNAKGRNGHASPVCRRGHSRTPGRPCRECDALRHRNQTARRRREVCA
jgi:hypothetical protein